MKENILLSIVSPVYRAENIVSALVSEIRQVVEKISGNYEIILVEDGSPDKSWEKIVEESAKDSRVKGIKLSRNFGQHYAITAGLQQTKGEWVVVMDCDLQDVPSEIMPLYKKALEGYDLVLAKRQDRQDKWIKQISSRAFYRVFSYLTDTKQDPQVANFGIYQRNVVDAILSMRDQIRYFPTMSQWVGFKRYYLPVQHSSRHEGKSSYNWSKLFHLAFDNILAFSNKPLKLTIRFGLLISLISLLIGVYYVYQYITGNIKVLGFTSIILSISFFSGIIIMFLGMLGLYLGKVFDKVKDRPVYIIDKIVNL